MTREDKQMLQSEKSSDVASDQRNTSVKHDSYVDEISYQFLTFKTEIATQPIWPYGHSSKDAPEIPHYQQYDDPLSWPRSRKQWMTYLACSVNGIAAYASGSYASPADELTAKWHISHIVYNVGLTIFVVGFGIAPMFLAPFSEINGRRPVFIVSGVLFVICTMCCALTESFGGMLAARLFQGIGASSFSTMVGGILADIWIAKDRNTAMVLFTGATLFGTGLGPLVSGIVEERLGWRWTFYLQIISSGTLIGLITVFFQETRGSVLLSRKAKLMNKYYQTLEEAGAIGVLIPQSQIPLLITRESLTPLTPPTNNHHSPPPHPSPLPSQPARLRYRVLSDEERATLATMILTSLHRPMHMLLTEPVVFWFSAWISFAWSILYLSFGSIPLVYRTNHDFTLAQTGYVFTAQCVAAIISTVLSIYQEQWGLKYHPRRIGGSPEGRLYFICIESALLPIGLFMFGWSCYSTVHWIVPTIAVCLQTMGIFSVFLGVFNYSADVYRIYASSALAASGVCRNLCAAAFPLVTNIMFNNLGFQVASSVLGGLGTFLSLVPWVLVAFGPTIRRRSRIARNFVEEDEKAKDKDAVGKKNDVEEGSGNGGDGGAVVVAQSTVDEKQ